MAMHMRHVVIIGFMGGYLGVGCQETTTPDGVISPGLPTPIHSRTFILKQDTESPTNLEDAQLNQVTIESAFTESICNDLISEGGVSKVTVFLIMEEETLGETISVQNRKEIEAVRTGLAYAMRPMVVFNKGANAGCPIEMEIRVRTRTNGVLRFWVTCIGFSVVPYAELGKVFFSRRLAETVDRILRNAGKKGLPPESLLWLSTNDHIPTP